MITDLYTVMIDEMVETEIAELRNKDVFQSFSQKSFFVALEGCKDTCPYNNNGLLALNANTLVAKA